MSSTISFPLRLTEAESKALDTVHNELGESTKTRTVKRLINERLQLRIKMEQDSKLITDLRARLSRADSALGYVHTARLAVDTYVANDLSQD